MWNASSAFEQAVKFGDMSRNPSDENFTGHYVYIKTQDEGDEVPEMIDYFRDTRTDEIVSVLIRQD